MTKTVMMEIKQNCFVLAARHLLIPILLGSFAASICFADETRTVIPIWPEGTQKVDSSIEETVVPRNFELVKNIHNPNLTVFSPKHPNGAAVVICPGGGYGVVASGLEGYPIAEKLNESGITAFVLKYRLPTTIGSDFKHPVPLSDALRAIQWVRSHATQYKLDTKRIGIMGFSAGGHLAATAGTLYSKYNFGNDEVSKVSSRPNFMCLGYPVISTQKAFMHGCVTDPLKAGFTPVQLEEMSCELNVNAQTPPTFLLHAKDDRGVLPQNSVVMHEALKKQGIATELKLYEKGGHGFGLGRKGTDSAQWSDDFINWLKEQRIIPGAAILLSSASALEIPVTDVNVQNGLSHYNWVCEDDYILTTVMGASLNLGFKDTQKVVMRVDLDQIQKTNNPNIDYPVIAWTVNGGELNTHQFALQEKSLILSSDTPDPVIEIFIKGMSPFGRRYVGDVPGNSLKITGFEIDAGGTTWPVTLPNKIWLNIGDSIMSGDSAAYAIGQGRPKNNAWAAAGDGRASYGYLLAKHYGYQEARIAYGGYAWKGGMSVGKLSDLIDQKTSTISRLRNGMLDPAPDVVLINLGENGVPAKQVVVASLTRLRSRVPSSTKIMVMVPVSGKGASALVKAFEAYQQISNDKNAYFIYVGRIKYSTSDRQHPESAGHQTIFEAVLPYVDGVFAGKELPRPIVPESFSLWEKQAPVGDGAFEALPGTPPDLSKPGTLTLYHAENGSGSLVVVCPGGGYGGVGVQGAEGVRTAKWLNSFGVSAAVLHYRLPKGRHQVPLLDVQRAIRFVRSKTTEWEIDAKRIGVLGYSAGGHLAASVSTTFDQGDSQAIDPIDRMGCRPDFSILVYPVITMGEKTHRGSKLNLLGPEPSVELVNRYSNELQVTKDTPPCFLAHAQDDGPVPPDNSRLYYEALLEHDLEAFYLKLPYGNHGLNGYKGPMWDAWIKESRKWMIEQGFVLPKQGISLAINEE